MDLIKIGKYIAEKRKGLGLTQRQVAEQLGMSDKSVSKWESGICLPDVSVYVELCEILGISINEFLAGEDIKEENIIQKSEDNLIQVTKDSKSRQKYLKRIIAVLSAIALFAVIMIGMMIYQYLSKPRNYVIPLDQDSAEMKTAKMLSGVDGAFLFRYATKEEYNTLTLYMSEYCEGQFIEKNEVIQLSYVDTEYPSGGMIAIVPDFDHFMVKVTVADDFSKPSTYIPVMQKAEGEVTVADNWTKCSAEISVLENVQEREYYGRSYAQIEKQTRLEQDKEQGLVALVYDNDELRAISIQDLENGNVVPEDDYIYYFFFQFGK